ncbi:MAG: hypothetical protein FWC19_09545 [Treponema sp.]|nr:hypothetical protein [Treponema sp.]MCL2273028.1 hypothetical protein [Treponema sp.]
MTETVDVFLWPDILQLADYGFVPYLEIAYALIQYGANPIHDLEELW